MLLKKFSLKPPKTSSSSLWLLATLLLPLLLNGCASLPEKYGENQLEFKILRFREDHKSLTNRYCSAWDDKNVCTKYEIKDYDLEDANVRDNLRRLNFICKVGAKRYKIDADSPRIRRDTTYKCGFLKLKTCWDSEFLDADATKLRDLNARCFSANKYPFDEA